MANNARSVSHCCRIVRILMIAVGMSASFVLAYATQAEQTQQPLPHAAAEDASEHRQTRKMNEPAVSRTVDWWQEADTVARDMTPHTEDVSYRNLGNAVLSSGGGGPEFNPRSFDDQRYLDHINGIFWINDDCAVVRLRPFCRKRFGHAESNGHLFDQRGQSVLAADKGGDSRSDARR
jgi:hypothetical protein